MNPFVTMLSHISTHLNSSSCEISLQKSNSIKSMSQGTNKQAEFERVFQYLDTNGDGKISPSELRHGLEMIGEGLTQEEVDAISRTGDGELGFEEFMRLVDAEEEERVESLRRAFRLYEAKGGQGITPKSLKEMLGRLGEKTTIQKCTTMIRRYDLDGDGVISFEEFKAMML